MRKEKKENKKSRKKRALGALLALRKHLAGACEKFSTLNDWNDFIRDHVDPVIDAFYDDLPSPWGGRLRKATQLTDDTRDALDAACSGLDDTVKHAVKAVTPKGPGWGTALAGAIVAAVAGGLVYLSTSAVTLTLTNQGCEPLMPTINVPIDLPGLSLPNKPIPTGTSVDMKIPGVQFVVDGSTAGVIRLTAYKMTFSFTLTDPSIDLRLDGQSLLGKTTSVNLGAAKSHELVVTCQ